MGDGSAGEHDEGEGGCGRVEPEGAADDETNSIVQSLEASVVDAQLDGGEDPFSVSADGAACSDEGGESAALGPGAPAVQHVGDFVGVEVTVEDGSDRSASLSWVRHEVAQYEWIR